MICAPPATRRPAELRLEVTPPWPYRLPSVAREPLYRSNRGVLHRLLVIGGCAVLVRVCVLSSGRVLFGACGRAPDAVLGEAIARMRRALGVDLDLAPFHRAFCRDPIIGAAVRHDPRMRLRGRPSGFEALLLAVCEQLIEFDRALAIERRIILAHGASATVGAFLGPGLDEKSAGARDCRPASAPDGRPVAARDLIVRDAPSATALACCSPAALAAMDLAPSRAATLVRAAREVAAGRVVLDDPDPAAQAAGWARLRRIPGIGDWTIEMLAVGGQGRVDLVPAGDLGYLKLVGWAQSGGDPRARASEADVRALLARYGEWRGLAGAYLLRSGTALRLALRNRALA